MFLFLCFEEHRVPIFEVFDCFCRLQNTQSLAFAKFEKEQWQLHFSNVSWEDFQNETVRRQVRILSVLGVSALSDEELSEVSSHCINSFLKDVSYNVNKNEVNVFGIFPELSGNLFLKPSPFLY